ncbi:amidase signature domain-containing protein [Podospora australis]|uniref:Amidase signature domain-containing protein n=1 Tax=Podospora australis TaxID=1536484 RepID=A0AAN7AGF5_9PEZI|nr:amidase signature domain-containing protein [Podospora australis]
MAPMTDRKLSARSLGLSVLSFIASISTASAKIASTGLSVNFNDVDYYISPFSSGKVDFKAKDLSKVPTVLGFKPVTVVQGGVSQKDVSKLLTTWTETDDVYQEGFAEAVFLAESKGKKPRNIIAPRHKGPAKPDSTSIITTKNTDIPSGPYFLEVSTGSLYPVYRLYEDFAGSFVESLIPTPDGKFQVMSAQTSGSASLTIGVPSRLYFTKTEKKPLAGVRIGIKDIYRLAGVKGSNGNRAWYNLYPAANYTGPAVQRLIDAGAQIVGLQKTSQFANGESATADWVDYHAPFNPRGDGYSDTSSSSAGAGASVAAYEWLDIALGSDTGGSVRGPAGVQGLFGNRPSHNLVSLDNVMPLSPTLDTPGFLVRDPEIWEAANAALYGKNYKSLAGAKGKKVKYPKKITTYQFPTNANTPVQKLLLEFADNLAKFVGGTVTASNLTNDWVSTAPAEAGGLPLNQFLNTTYATLITKEQIELVREPFYRDYAAANDGRRPFVNPVPLSRWAYGDSVGNDVLQEAYRAKATFMSWFNSKILPGVADENQCSDSLFLYTQSQGGQNPRNRYRNAPGVPFGFSAGRISVFAEVPDVVFPLGEVSSFSEISKHEEVYPVAVSIMAAKGCDGLLTKLAQDLVAAGIVKVPKAGGTLAGGKVLMRRGLEGVHDHQ